MSTSVWARPASIGGADVDLADLLTVRVHELPGRRRDEMIAEALQTTGASSVFVGDEASALETALLERARGGLAQATGG